MLHRSGITKTQAKQASYFVKISLCFKSLCYLPHLDLCSYESLLVETLVIGIWVLVVKTANSFQTISFIVAMT